VLGLEYQKWKKDLTLRDLDRLNEFVYKGRGMGWRKVDSYSLYNRSELRGEEIWI
jgi:hypothetical protein